jgi:hypothetical protein
MPYLSQLNNSAEATITLLVYERKHFRHTSVQLQQQYCCSGSGTSSADPCSSTLFACSQAGEEGQP